MASKVALITGGAKGIGRAVALDLAAAGRDIALCYRASEREAAETVALIQKHGRRALAQRCDVSDPAAAAAFAEKVEREFGPVEALINCAGPYHRVNILEETPTGWAEMFAHNLHAVFYMSKALAPAMKARKAGRIVSFSMANADQMVAQTEVTAHYIAKAGVLILTRTLAKALAPHGVTVNAVSPGFINSGSAPEAELAAMAKKIPAGYIGELKDAVSAVRFLLSDEARYITGTNIHLSGGWGI
ncbi:MAG: SDR family oxidoreductase [Nitrospirae bacterium]|nr:MAG: SDR family oxidoreductase [Nitrospirota bacterium]